MEFYGNTKIGTFKWTGGGEYGGKGYCFPRKENSLLEIDVSNKRTREIALHTGYRGEHHYGGVISPEGIIYQPPRNTDHILRVDLESFETRRIPIIDEMESYRYSASVLYPNGDIYMIPEFGGRFLVLHKDTEEVEVFGMPSDHLVFGAVVGIDGNIYGYSKEGKGIMKIDPISKKVEYVCTNIGNPDCYGAVVGINGRIYGVPANGKSIWEFDVERQEVRKLFNLEESGIVKCAGGGLRLDGTIVLIPCFGEYIYFIKNSLNNNVLPKASDLYYFNLNF